MSQTTTPKANLFANAKKKEPAKKAAKQHVEVVIPESKHVGFSAKLIELAEIRKRLTDDEARAKTLEQEIKDVGRSAFVDLYLKNKVNPGTFMLKGEDGGSFLVITQDKYTGIDETRHEELVKLFGSNTVNKVTTYSLDGALLEKYMDVISDAINGIEEIPEEDKASLFIADEKFSIAKGAINLVPSIKEEDREHFIYNIQPQMQLKYSEEK